MSWRLLFHRKHIMRPTGALVTAVCPKRNTPEDEGLEGAPELLCVVCQKRFIEVAGKLIELEELKCTTC